MKELAIYIHIPFCVQKCRYCDFLSGSEHFDKIENYIEMLIKEMNQYRDLVKDYNIRSVFLGGGTPSILSVVQIRRIVNALWDLIGDRMIPNAEVTIESNPGTLTGEKLKTYLELGINRISMGLQSTHDEELKELGRIHTYKEFLEGYRLARDVGFQNINIDLMSGLPNQTLEKWETTLQRIIELKPEHISAYSLIIEEGTKFYETYGNEEGEKCLPGEELDRMMYQKTREILKEAGYERYEISNYAKSGYESRHNCAYWTGIDYLGLGLGASSFLNDKRYHNEENMTYYIQKLDENKLVRNLDEELFQKNKMEEFMILGLRMMQGVEKQKFKKQFGQNIEQVYAPVLTKLKELDMLREIDGRIFLSDQGIDVSNEIFTMFLLD